MQLKFIFLFVAFQVTSISQTEIHLKNLTMLTHGGDNAEDYFSFDGK